MATNSVIAANLSQTGKNVIVKHVDGPRRVYVAEIDVLKRLLEQKILRSCDADGNARQRGQPLHFTILTDYGRDVLACVLADYAEVLVRAGCLDADAVPISIIPYAVETIELRRRRRGAPQASVSAPEKELIA